MSRGFRAFTLIELVLATALAAMLMIAVLAVLTGINRDQERLGTAASSEHQDKAALVELMRRDLSGSIEFKMTSQNTLVLETTNSLSPAKAEWNGSSRLKRVDRPSTVTYRLVSTGDGNSLIRQQQFSDEPVPPAPLKSIVAFHVVRFSVKGMDETGAQLSASTRPASADRPQALPKSVRVQLEFDDPSAAIDAVVCLR